MPELEDYLPRISLAEAIARIYNAMEQETELDRDKLAEFESIFQYSFLYSQKISKNKHWFRLVDSSKLYLAVDKEGYKYLEVAKD